MRVAVGGIHTESSTWNPVTTGLEDFRVLRGGELTAHDAFNYLCDTTLDIAPLLHARAIPGGRVTRDTYEVLKAEFLDRLSSAGPLDGFYLAMHGAMFVDGMEDAEGDWITAVRAAIGPDLPLSVSYDLHGNVSQRIVDAIDMFAAYRTAPHIDVRETGVRALAMLKRCLDTEERPFVAVSRVPVLLPGERTATTDEPVASLYRQLPSFDRLPGIWDANLMIGYVWADEPRATACGIVTGTDRDAIGAAANAIAQSYFDVREDCRFPVVTESIGTCLALAEAATTMPVILADSGDNPTGGGVGDRADVLAALLQRGFTGAVVAGIADPKATAACFSSGLGMELSLSIGAGLDAINSVPLPVKGRVSTLDPGRDPGDARAVIDIAGNRVVVTARRRPFHAISDFTSLGIELTTTRLLVVKSGYLSPELAPIARPNLMALSPGVVSQDIARLPVKRISRPTFPFDTELAYRPKVHLSGRAARIS
jgi:microcystin degradation protein MlrC